MKWKYILLLALVSAGITSCDVGNDNNFAPIEYEVAGITSVEVPDSFKFGEVNEIIVRYNNPTDCNVFAFFDVVSELNERDVAVVTVVQDNGVCDVLNVPTEQTLRFLAMSNRAYLFKFYMGKDADGNAEYLEYNINVVP